MDILFLRQPSFAELRPSRTLHSNVKSFSMYSGVPYLHSRDPRCLRPAKRQMAVTKKEELQLVLCKQAQKYIFPKKQEEQTLNLCDQPGESP